MPILTLIPNADSYGLLVLISLIFGSFHIARHIHVRLLHRYMSFMTANAVIKGIILCIGLGILPIYSLFTFQIMNEIVSLLLGMASGLFLLYFETKIFRHVNRKIPTKEKIAADDSNLRIAKIHKKINLISTLNECRQGLVHVREGHNQFIKAPDFIHYKMSSILMVAIAEEILFKGFLFSLINVLFQGIMWYCMLALSIMLFAFSHTSLSIREFFIKMPLSLLSALSFLLTHSVLGSITMHGMVNAYAYFHNKKFSHPMIRPLHQPIGLF